MSKNKILKTSLLNIDSAFRNLFPKNICKSDNKILPRDPLELTKNSNILTINYPSHNLISGDNIIIQNVEGMNKTLVNSFILVNNFKYLIILFDENNPNMIDPDYKYNIDSLYINIEIVGTQTENNLISNIPFNSIVGIKKSIIANDIPLNYLMTIEELSVKLFKSFDINVLNKYCLFVELPTAYINKQDSHTIINQVFKISYLHIGGIPLGYFNSNYPINNYNYQSNYQVNNIIDDDNFQIVLKYSSYGDIFGGGKNIQIMKILNSITGYPNASNYVITLKQSFNNVINIELISSEFPYIDVSIKKNVNNKLYWKNIEDGDIIYVLELDEGFYTGTTLLNQLITKINKVPRINMTKINQLYNYFDIILESNNQKITFSPYNLSQLPNSLAIYKDTIDNVEYFILNVTHPNNIVESNDTIEIKNSVDIVFEQLINNEKQSYLISSTYINKSHNVYNVNNQNQTYDILLGKISEIKINNVNESISRGGENIIVKSKTKVSFLFDKPDTIGDILGFKDPGSKYSITEFSSIITNKDFYINSNNLDSVGNEITYSSGYLNLSGKYNYFLMYLNDIEYIYSNNNLPSAFAKINLSGNPGDVLFNTFVYQPHNIYSKVYPIPTLNELTIKFIYPDGSYVDFRNINHSFTLKITEELVQNDNTYLNSQVVSVSDEFRRANLQD